MSFTPSKERIMHDRFIKAEEIRSIKKNSHKLIAANHVDKRKEILTASNRVHSLENTLKQISKLREQRKLCKEMQIELEKIHISMMLREKVKKLNQEQSLKLRIKRIIELSTPQKSSKSPEVESVNHSPKSISKNSTPVYLRNYFKMSNPSILKSILPGKP